MNFLELCAKITADTSDYDKSLDNAESKGKSFSKSLGKAVGAAAKVTAAAATAAIGAAATGITSLTTQAVNAYGTYEQLVGGVNKIFGDSADSVMANADKAFSTAGMSANQYMETVTGFSAALINSLGGDTQKAANLADTAIRDMSDNANTFGTDIQSIMNAYQGFSKQNYTMLDNLKLGYGGTKSEVERLIRDAEKLDSTFSVTHKKTKQGQDEIVYGYADVVEAIHIVQGEMNITGTTAKEAATTIQGTAGSLKGAWENLIIGLGNANADLGPLIDNVVQSALQMVNNIKPIALQAVKGIASLIEGFAPVLAEELPKLVNEVLPSLSNAIVLLIDAAANTLPSLIEVLLPPLLSAITNVIKVLIVQFPKILVILTRQLPTILQEIIPAILAVAPDVISAGIQIIWILGQALADNAGLIMDSVMSLIHMIVDTMLTADNIQRFIEVAAKIIFTIAEAIISNIPEILGAIVVLAAHVVQALIQAFPSILNTCLTFIADLGDDLGDLIYSWLGDTGLKIIEDIGAWFDGIKQWGSDVFGYVTEGLGDLIGAIVDFGKDVGKTFTDIWDNAKKIVSDAIDALLKLFDFDWSLPKIKLPHFKVSGGEAPWGFGGQGSLPSVKVEWYQKAMNTPYLLDNAAIFGAAGGKLLGGGEAGKELVYGHEQLMSDIAAVVDSRLANIELVAPIYIGGKKIDQQIVTVNARNAVVSGGR